jgi:hypothetical protein
MTEIKGFKVEFIVILDVTDERLASDIAASMEKELREKAEVLDVWTMGRPSLARVKS